MLKRLPWLRALPLLLLLASGATRVEAEAEIKPPAAATVRAFKTAAEACATVGLHAEAQQFLDVLRMLGAPEKDLERAMTGVERIARKTRKKTPRKGARATAGRSLRKATTTIQAALRARIEGGATETPRLAFARLLVHLDPNDAIGAKALGRVESQGVWRHPASASMSNVSGQHMLWAAQARQLEFRGAMEVESLPSPVPERWQAKGVTRVSFKQGQRRASLWSGDMPAEEMKIYLNQALRSLALACAVLGGELAPELGGTTNLVIFTDRASERSAFRRAVEAKRIDPILIPAYEGGSWHYTMDGYHHAFRNFPTTYGREVFFLIGGARMRSLYTRRVHAGLAMGLLNWCCYQVQGLPLARYLKIGEISKAGGRYAHEQDSEYQRFLILRYAGLAGMRTWLEFLARRGDLPVFEDGVQSQLSKIEGDLRTFFTFYSIYLAQLDQLHSGFKLLSRPYETKKLHAGYEASRGGSIPVLVEAFADWLLGRGFGADRPLHEDAAFGAGRPDLAKQYPEAEALRRYLNRLRATTLHEDDAVITFLDGDLCDAGAKHLAYLRLNPDETFWPNMHMEFPDLEGYTPEGARAGLNSNIFSSGAGRTTPKKATDWCLATFYHRLPMLKPDIVAIGAHFDEDGGAMLDIGSMREPGKDATPYVLWPAPDAKDVFLAFGPEQPNPVPGEDMYAWGYPITVQRFGATGEERDAPHALALYKKKVGPSRQVDCWFISPTASYHPNLVLSDVWCLIPKARLSRGTRYVVVLKSGGTVVRTWSFQTGSNPGFYAR